MKLSIFGMGYVGCVTGACFAEMGHDVIGVEPNATKVRLINAGKSPIVEDGLEELIGKGVRSGLFRATEDWGSVVDHPDLALVCVGTPCKNNGSVDMGYVERVCEQIGLGLARRERRLTVVIRSTVLPGTIDNIVIPTIERTSGKKAGKDFGVCMHPEFLREGVSIHDFHHPPKTVIGECDEQSGAALAALYDGMPGEIVRTSVRVAEMVKFADNCFHALKVTFANEIGNICQATGADSHRVMEIFCQDRTLNLSPSYLKPGFAFGGSCLPKDLRAIIHEARSHDVDAPVLDAVLSSNRRQIEKLINKLVEFKGCRLGFLGLSFKRGTDDLRSSPIVEVVEAMIGKGFTVGIYDSHVSLAKLMGANREYIEKEIPHLSNLMYRSADDLVEASDVAIVSHRDGDFQQSLGLLHTGKTLVDLVGIGNRRSWNGCKYYGISW